MQFIEILLLYWCVNFFSFPSLSLFFSIYLCLCFSLSLSFSLSLFLYISPHHIRHSSRNYERSLNARLYTFLCTSSDGFFSRVFAAEPNRKLELLPFGSVSICKYMYIIFNDINHSVKRLGHDAASSSRKARLHLACMCATYTNGIKSKIAITAWSS